MPSGKKGKGRGSDPPVDREAKTPNQTGSFAVFHENAQRIIKRLYQIVAIKEHVSDLLDISGPQGSRELRKIIHELEVMSKRFATWPYMHPETVALERPHLVNRLMDLRIFCSELALKTPGLPKEDDYDVEEDEESPKTKIGSIQPVQVKKTKPPPPSKR